MTLTPKGLGLTRAGFTLTSPIARAAERSVSFHCFRRAASTEQKSKVRDAPSFESRHRKNQPRGGTALPVGIGVPTPGPACLRVPRAPLHASRAACAAVRSHGQHTVFVRKQEPFDSVDQLVHCWTVTVVSGARPPPAEPACCHSRAAPRSAPRLTALRVRVRARVRVRVNRAPRLAARARFLLSCVRWRVLSVSVWVGSCLRVAVEPSSCSQQLARVNP